MNVNEKTTNTLSNFDLMKVMLITMILFHHFSYWNLESSFHFNFFDNVINSHGIIYTINCLLSDIMLIGGKIATNCFVLISGYFLIDYKKDFVKKIVIFFMNCMIFSTIVYLFSIVMKQDDFSIIQLILCVIAPVDKFWFLHAYLSLLIVAPFLNKYLHELNKKEFGEYLLVLFFVWCILLSFGFTSSNFRITGFGWFVFLYSLSAYYKLHFNKNKFEGRQYIFFFVISFLVLLFVCELKAYLETKITFKELLDPVLWSQNNIFVLLCSIFLFTFFETISIKYNKYLHFISSSSLPVYMLHASTPGLIYLGGIINGEVYINKSVFLPYSIYVCFTVFAVCLLINILVTCLFKKPISYLANEISSLIVKIKEKIL